MRTHYLALLPLLAASALAQLPPPVSILRASPRAAWHRVISGGFSGITTTHRNDTPGAATGDRIYVFGGRQQNSLNFAYNDLWEFDAVAGTFLELIPNGATGSPHARGRCAVAWNPVVGRLYVYGGWNYGSGPAPAGTVFGDIWEYDPGINSWTDVTPLQGNPPLRYHAAMAFEPNTGGLLMFGGTDETTVFADTWSFVGGSWTLLSPSTAPPARTQPSLAVRPDFQDVFLCGGIDGMVRHLDAWSWNGADWVLLNDGSLTFPANVHANQAVYDQLRQRIVMQGGEGIGANTGTTYYTALGNEYGGSPSNYCSEFDCLTNEWLLYANPKVDNSTQPTPAQFECNLYDPAIGRISRYAAGFVPATGMVYKIVGQRQGNSSAIPVYAVYKYGASPLADATAYGVGCNGLSFTADNLPWTGRTFQATASGFTPGAIALSVIGFGTAATPLSTLHPAGMPGCELNVTSDASVLLFPAGSSATVSLDLPADPAFAGLVLNWQVAQLELDALGNLVALSSTNALALLVGAL